MERSATDRLGSSLIRICSAQEMRELDRQADASFGIDGGVLMESAGAAAVQVILERYPEIGHTSEVLVFAGKGNNAGDAFVVARRLHCLGRRVRVFHLHAEDAYTGPVRKNFDILRKLRVKLIELESAGDLEAFFRSGSGPYSIVDGLLGTGLVGSLEGMFFDLVELINAAHASGQAPEVIALDIPTGVSGDTGTVGGSAIQATLTLSFGFPKLGHFLPPGASRRGELINLDITLPPQFRSEGETFLLTKGAMAGVLEERDRYGHKNAFGHTLLIGGSPGRIGAIVMSARACHKMGTGLVTAATWVEAIDLLQIKLADETMSFPVRFEAQDLDFYKRSLPQYSSVVVGPGLGMRPEGRMLVEELLKGYQGPVVLDADALNLVADHKLHEFLVRRQAPTVLTPHPGEMARLLDQPREKIMANPVASVREAVDRTHCIVLLKGAATLIGSPAGRTYLNHYPNDGMATAGSGDVLAGMIGGLLGQRMDPEQATLLGVLLHSLAGDHAARVRGHRSMTSADIIENISHAFGEIKQVREAARAPVESRVALF